MEDFTFTHNINFISENNCDEAIKYVHTTINPQQHGVLLQHYIKSCTVL